MTVFLLSYASADAKRGPFLDAFWHDLVNRVDGRVPPTMRPVGFRDSGDIPLGAQWEPALSNALNTCSVLVPLISEGLIASENCGQEWTFFSRRIEAWQRAHPAEAAPAVILPILWAPSVTRPKVLEDLQYNHAGLGKAYAESGLEFLTRVRTSNDYLVAYETFVEGFATKIMDALKVNLPSLDPVPDLRSLPSAFHRVQASNGQVATRPEPNGRPDHVRFVVVAGVAAKVGAVRNDLGQYGPTWRQWRPFSPQSDERVVVLAPEVAASPDIGRLSSEFVPPEADLATVVEEADQDGDLVVLLVDPWTVALDNYRDRMRAHDRRSVLSQAILALWNDHDRESALRADDLMDFLVTAFPSQTGGSAAELACCSLDTFQARLASALVAAQARVINTRASARRAGRGGPVPTLDATKAPV